MLNEAGVVGQKDPLYSHRVTDVSWIPPTQDTQWLFARIAPLFKQWQITRIAPLQYSVYRPGGHFDWHNDNGLRPDGQLWYTSPISNRVVSAVINLSRPDEYTGGGLEIKHPSGVAKAPTHRGATAVFTSTMYHRVKPITTGIRKTLVIWALR